MASVSGGSKRERFGFIARYGSLLGVRYLCNWLKVSPAGYYKWLKQPIAKRDIENRELLKRIRRIYDDNKTNYGSPRVYAALRREGVLVNHKRVERLMREASLVGKAGRIYRRKPAPGKFYTKMPNIRAESAPPNSVNQQWVGDLTYLKVSGQWRYLAVVMDAFSRRIIGWKLGAQKTAELTRESIHRAIISRQLKPGLIFHSDRGSEYGAYIVQDELKRAGIKPSMNRPYHPTDNAHMESFFQSMKTECIRGVTFKDDRQLRGVIANYINRYYNAKRLHSSIGYRTPIEFEQMAA